MPDAMDMRGAAAASSVPLRQLFQRSRYSPHGPLALALTPILAGKEGFNSRRDTFGTSMRLPLK